MNFDLFSRSKYRANDKSGDDVALVLPGVCFGVLDGATDAEGRDLNGIPYGRAASMVASQVLAEILLPYRNREKTRKHFWQISVSLMRGHLRTTTSISFQPPLWLWP